MKQLEANETALIGGWVRADGKTYGDDVVQRIRRLTEGYLVEVAKDWSKWYTLYRDPHDGRYWEIEYLQGERQGAGPPSLIRVSRDQIVERYGMDVSGCTKVGSDQAVALHPNEKELVGSWIIDNGELCADTVVKRIRDLIRTRLTFLATDWSRLFALYLDPADGRYWERRYLPSDCLGGGPPSLAVTSPEQIKTRYGLDV